MFSLRFPSCSDGVFSSVRDRRVFKEGRLSYADFVWFLISEEDKKTDTRYQDSGGVYDPHMFYLFLKIESQERGRSSRGGILVFSRKNQ